MNDYSAILFARPSFVEGMARAIDIGGTLNEYNRSINGAAADRLAMWADWMAVAGDLNYAIGEAKAKGQRGVKALEKA